MSLFDAREILSNGDNSTDVIIGDVHFNLTTLNHWNYTLYDNGTISNGSECFLTFAPYTPSLVYPNGTFINRTSCYTPIKPIATRGGVGLAFACLFALSLICTLINLTRHGRLYLPVEKRFYPIGRRWQWYWAIFMAATAMVGLFFGVDVDRFYLPELPIVINSFFWFLLQMGTMACVWEGARHWGSWMERQFIDPNPFVLQQTDRRGMFELLLPLFFYLWLWLNFFLIIPRNWGKIEQQRSDEQTVVVAEPSATDIRFKIAVFCLFIAWLSIVVSLWHSIRHYEARNRGLVNRFVGGLGYLPLRFVLMLPLALAMVAYQGLVAWDFDVSPLKVKTNLVSMYVGGYAPALLIVIIQNVSGFLRPNEDKALIQQRRERGVAHDQELGLVRKPAWWKRVNGDGPAGNMRDRIMRNVRELGGGRATAESVHATIDTRAREAETAANIEMNQIGRTNSVASTIRQNQQAPPPYSPYGGKSGQRRSERTVQAAATLLFPNAPPPPPPPPTVDAGRGRANGQPEPQRQGSGERSNSTNSNVSSLNRPAQQVRSMLDV